ncbi:MAG TPA: S9 family peptidase [Vicinamibacteria bacterium]|nr:S9 family peptidase [Vicinamibacteria bacterium]
MRTSLLPATLLAAVLIQPVLAGDRPSGWTPELLMTVKRVSSVQVSPDGSRVAYVVAGALMEGEKSEWLSHIQVARADGSGSFQLTQGEKSATAPAWSPDGKWIGFLSARGKEGKNNVWRIRADGGEAEQITEEKAAVSAFRFSPDGGRIAFLSADPKSDDEEKAEKEKRDARVVDADLKMIRLRVLSLAKDEAGKRAPRVLTPVSLSVGNIGGGADFKWSPDSRSIVFTHQPSPKIDDWTKADVSVVGVETGTVKALAATRAVEGDPHYSPDGKWIALTVSEDPPSWRRRGRVALLPVEGAGAPKRLAVSLDEQPRILGFTADAKRVLVTETHRTVSSLSAVPVDGSPAQVLTPADMMIDGVSLNARGTHLGFTSQGPDRAPEAYLSPLAAFAATQVSHAQDLPSLPFGKTEVISWKAADGKTIEGLLTLPVAYQAGTPVPLLVIVHGGPAGVFVRSFTGMPTPYPVAVFGARGYAVLRANIRGSSGYGFDFRNANFRDWGGADYQDLLAGVDQLVSKGIADPDRLGIMGWSYGGFMTSWAVTQTKRFKAASVGAGVTNLMSFTGTADIPGFLPDYFGGELWDVFEVWRAHSAMFQVKGVSTPTLIQHGDADLRVPISQGYEFYNALKRQGVVTKMVVYPRQPHGLQEPKLILDAMNRNLEWFDEWVMGRTPAQP